MVRGFVWSSFHSCWCWCSLIYIYWWVLHIFCVVLSVHFNGEYERVTIARLVWSKQLFAYWWWFTAQQLLFAHLVASLSASHLHRLKLYRCTELLIYWPQTTIFALPFYLCWLQTSVVDCCDILLITGSDSAAQWQEGSLWLCCYWAGKQQIQAWNGVLFPQFYVLNLIIFSVFRQSETDLYVKSSLDFLCVFKSCNVLLKHLLKLH